MTCETGQRKAGQAATRSGIARSSNRAGSVAAGSVQVSFFGVNTRSTRRKIKRRQTRPANRKQETIKKKTVKAQQELKAVALKQHIAQGKSTHNQGRQVSFFEIARVNGGSNRPAKRQSLPTQRHVRIVDDFTSEELQRMSVQLALGGAAAARQLQELTSGSQRGIGHSDPRPADWAKADLQHFRFLADQLARVRRGDRYLDTSALKSNDLVDLWEFAKFEADRAQRNIDHLRSGLSHLKGPTADYLVAGHQLEARFYTLLVGQLEPLISTEMVDRYLC